ncbi:MAG: hypothetical protein COA90_00875 [Gammaproteobacteria bacterium]|nr:MAG: hypothetical protein COA90_00875 [Gammaproteobacteria bacterium]
MKTITLKENGTFEHLWLKDIHSIPANAIEVSNAIALTLSQNQTSKAYDAELKSIIDFQPAFVLSTAKHIKIAEVKTAVKNQITGGFYSDALGSPRLYQSEIEDQLNLDGTAGSGDDWPFKCSSDEGRAWINPLHTTAQLQQVRKDGITHKLAALQLGEIAKAQIRDLPDTATQADIDAVTVNFDAS